MIEILLLSLQEITLDSIQDPLLYSILFFIYVILAAIILPIPVEIGLFNPYMNPVVSVAIMAFGKAIGAAIVFFIGFKIHGKMQQLTDRIPLFQKLLDKTEGFVRKYGYLGLFIIMSTPLMIDSVSLYLFSILNPQDNGKTALAKKWFISINFFAGATRAVIILLIAALFSIRLI